MKFTPADKAHMTRALRLAERGLWTTKPNPRVGCVIAHGETIVGEGWHARAGEPHAEMLALRDAGERARGASAYVTLEPCAHHGRTPPCVDALIAAGVARVVVATGDSNPKVAGGGIARLRAAGIEVQDGLLRDNARALNQGFFSRMERGRPWVRVKIAASLDGRIALGTGESKWITGSAARADVQRWRARSSALMTGIGTVLADDPRLTARPRISGRRERPGTKAAVPRLRDESTAPIAAILVPPLRVILDSTLRTPAQARILDGEAPALIVHARDATPVDTRFDRIERIAVDCVEGRLDLVAVLEALAAREVNELQIEAGSTLVGSFLRSGLVDEVLIYIAPVFLGDTARPIASMPALAALKDAHIMTLVEQRTLRPDVRLRLLSEFHDVHRNH